MRLERTWKPRPSEHPLPPLPPELAERPGIVWLYTCRSVGLTMHDLKCMRIDQAEALVELQEFVNDTLSHREEDMRAQDAEDAFWSL